MSINGQFSMAMLNNQRVTSYVGYRPQLRLSTHSQLQGSSATGKPQRKLVPEQRLESGAAIYGAAIFGVPWIPSIYHQ